jgi:hypothetical protein
MLTPSSVAASWHAPVGPSAEKATGHHPRTHPLAVPRLPGLGETVGPEASAASISSPRMLISPGLLAPLQVLEPQMICQPK